MPINKKLELETQLSYYQLNYHAKANWNLIAEFQHPVSFTHSAKGYALTSKLNLSYTVTARTSLLLGGTYSYWTTGKGTDTLYLANGNINTTILNGVNRNGYGVTFGIQLTF